MASRASDQSASPASSEYARVLRRGGRNARAEATSSKLLKLALDTEDPDAALDHYTNIGISLRRRGEITQSLSTWRTALDYARQLDPRFRERLAFLLDNLGVTLRKDGNLGDARVALEEAIQLWLVANSKRGLAHSYNNLGLVERDDGDLEAAEAMHRSAMRLFDEASDRSGQASAAGRLAAALEELDRGAESRVLYQEALALSSELDDRRGEAIAHVNLSRSVLI